jgi:hypothetical protein
MASGLIIQVTMQYDNIDQRQKTIVDMVMKVGICRAVGRYFENQKTETKLGSISKNPH